MPKHPSFFDMLEKESFTNLVIENDIKKESISVYLTREWSEKTTWNGKNSKNLLKKVVEVEESEIYSIIDKYELREYFDDLASLLKDGKHKKLLFLYEPVNKVKCILTCHNTSKDYVVGGIRRAADTKPERAVISDALCLCKGMSYRCAVAGIPCSGITLSLHTDSPKEEIANDFFGFLAYIIERYNIFVAPESGFSKNEVTLLKSFTDKCVMDESSLPNAISMAAMYSVYLCIRESLSFRYPNNPEIAGKTIAVQGMGIIGSNLATRLLDEGAELIITDIDDYKIEGFLQGCNNHKSVSGVEFNAITMQMGHVFAPCAFSGVINRDSITDFDYHIVAGGANNLLNAPLFEDELYLANIMMKKGILYIPDFVSNFGGAMYGVSLFMEKGQTSLEKKQKQMEKIIKPLIHKILTESKEKNVSPLEISYKKLDPKIY